MLDEVWAVVEQAPNYSVSNYGRVINTATGYELQPSPTRDGYLKVGLTHEGVRYHVYVSRLVASAFFLNYKPGVAIKHKNENLQDNSVLNLSLGPGCRSSNDSLI